MAGERELEGQVALVTGGAKNIGRATCLELAAAGAAVAVNAQTSAKEAEELAAEINASGGRAMAHIADIRDPDAVDVMIAAVVEQLGGLNHLINNASLRQLCPLEELTLDKWRAIMAVTVEGSYLCARAAIPHMRKAGLGSIVNISGIASQAGIKDRLHAATANAALEGMARSLAHEVSDFGGTANAVSPGLIDTVRGSSAGTLPGQMGGAENLIGRKGKPSEIAGMVRTLCGPAGRYVTGQTICVNGGIYFN